jgi:hypothetical protein
MRRSPWYSRLRAWRRQGGRRGRLGRGPDTRLRWHKRALQTPSRGLQSGRSSAPCAPACSELSPTPSPAPLTCTFMTHVCQRAALRVARNRASPSSPPLRSAAMSSAVAPSTVVACAGGRGGRAARPAPGGGGGGGGGRGGEGGGRCGPAAGHTRGSSEPCSRAHAAAYYTQEASARAHTITANALTHWATTFPPKPWATPFPPPSPPPAPRAPLR